jgi:hypothetical protein
MVKKVAAVEKNVPIPPVVTKQGVNVVMLAEMEPGDSRWWSSDDAKRTMRFYRVAKKLGIKILIRKVGSEDPQGPGVRMWRVAQDDDAFVS